MSVTQRKKKCLDKQHAVIQQTEVTDRCIDYNKKEYQKHPSSLKRNEMYFITTFLKIKILAHKTHIFCKAFGGKRCTLNTIIWWLFQLSFIE